MLSNETVDLLKHQFETELAKLKESGVTVYGINDDPAKAGIVLSSYGRNWTPSNGEEFFVPENTVIVYTKYTVNKEIRDRANFYGWSSLTGWDYYPVNVFAASPDVLSERAILCKDPENGHCLNRMLITRQDDLQRCRTICKLSKFTVEEIVLHGPTWEENAAGQRVRIADAEDKPNRAPYSYYRIVY